MRRKTKRQTKIQKNGVTKIRVFMKGGAKVTPKMINKAQQAAMHYMNVRNAILEEVLKERTGLKTIPLTDDQKRRLAQAGAKVDELTLGKIEREFSPETVYGWYNKLVGDKYSSVSEGQKRRGPKTITDELRDVILKMSMENPAWGYQRIANYLVYLGFDVTFMTVKRVLDNYGIYPPDDLHRGGDWHNFIESHKAITAACDFVTYEMPQENGELQRAHILFFENLGSREVWCGGIAVNLDAQWMAQVARNQTDCFSGKLIAPWPQSTHGEIRCFSRLGGLLKSYRRVA